MIGKKYTLTDTALIKRSSLSQDLRGSKKWTKAENLEKTQGKWTCNGWKNRRRSIRRLPCSFTVTIKSRFFLCFRVHFPVQKKPLGMMDWWPVRDWPEWCRFYSLSKVQMTSCRSWRRTHRCFRRTRRWNSTCNSNCIFGYFGVPESTEISF